MSRVGWLAKEIFCERERWMVWRDIWRKRAGMEWRRVCCFYSATRPPNVLNRTVLVCRETSSLSRPKKKFPLRPQIFIRFVSWICAVFISTSHKKAKQEIFSQKPLSFSKLVVIVTAHDVVLDEGKNCLRSLS